jgi:hypothetical protein
MVSIKISADVASQLRTLRKMKITSLTPTEHPSPMPTSEGFPGQPKPWFRGPVSAQHSLLVFSEGCDHTNYVRSEILKSGAKLK